MIVQPLPIAHVKTWKRQSMELHNWYVEAQKLPVEDVRAPLTDTIEPTLTLKHHKTHQR